VAVIAIGPEGVTATPIEDRTQVRLAAMATCVFALFWIVRLIRGGADSKDAAPAKLASTVRRLRS